jgi:integrase
MPRPRNDGTEARPKKKQKLDHLLITKAKPEERPYLVWDAHQKGLALAVRPNGQRTFKVVYRRNGLLRWYHLGDARVIGLANARKLALGVMYEVTQGKDPQAERKAQRASGTFEELARRYVEEHAKVHNKSWRQADTLVRRYLLPKWGKLNANAITRGDMKVVMRKIEAPVLANQVLASASAVFAWGIKEDVGQIKENPCRGVSRNKTESRERVLSENELPRFWQAFDQAGLIAGSALKVILLTGQRPGEVLHMRREHVEGSWWTMPGKPVEAVGWPGTKNGASHAVHLPERVLDVLAELDDDGKSTGFIFKPRSGLDQAMRRICETLGVERLTPHDLRRTHGTMVTALGFGRDAMNRVQNHKEGGIGSVYDRHGYAEENKRVMQAVAARILALAEGGDQGNVVHATFTR